MIPEPLRQRLRGSPLEGVTLTVVDAFATILADNKTPFFPYYTDHGAEHVKRVMEACVRLVPTEAWEAEDLFTATDAAVIIVACFLHDIALHIREPGFVALVDGTYPSSDVSWVRNRHGARSTDAPWPDLWRSFTKEARHFGRSQVDRLLGPDADGVPAVAYGEQDPSRWVLADHLLIGEFLRRHHARLSHEIAVCGFPGIVGELPLLPPPVAHAAGLVARSHGESLRLMVAYLEDEFGGNLRPAGVVLPYLMGLLRVADYLQLDADRAPATLLGLRQPESLQTLEEWNKHGAVSTISWHGRDPLGIHIEVLPTHGLRTYLALEELFDGLERELALTTGILSEIYRTAPFQALRLSRQRVHTNLESAALQDALPFVPRRTALSSDEDLFRLVIDDLYGKQPGVAVRELLQNAVDAVRERWRQGLQGDGSVGEDDELGDAEVLVSVEERADGHVLRIKDHGVGMTADTIERFFLTAGASFGPSMAERESLSVEDSVRTAKAGRFGVGAFAPFLLGPCYEVRTRHLHDPGGLTFVADISEDLVELTRTGTASVGTEVVVPISLDRLVDVPSRLVETAAVFYCLDKPRVRFQYVDADGRVTTTTRQIRRVPSPDIELPTNWRRFSPTDFDVVYWTPRSRGQSVVHNGFAVRNPSQGPPLLRWASNAAAGLVAVPEMAIFDPSHKMRLTLHRYDFVTPHLPFEDELLLEIGLDLVAFVRKYGGRSAYPLSRNGALGSVDSDLGWFPATPGMISRYVKGRLLVVNVALDDDVREHLRSTLDFDAVVEVPFTSAKAWFGSWISALSSTEPVVLCAELTRPALRHRHQRFVEMVKNTLGEQEAADFPPPDDGPLAPEDIDGYRWTMVETTQHLRCSTVVRDGAPMPDVSDLVAAASAIAERNEPARKLLLWSVCPDHDVAIEHMMAPWEELVGGPLPRGDEARPELERRLARSEAAPKDWEARLWGSAGNEFYD